MTCLPNSTSFGDPKRAPTAAKAHHKAKAPAHRLFLRGQVYQWQKRLPKPLAARLGSEAVRLSLRTTDRKLAIAIQRAIEKQISELLADYGGHSVRELRSELSAIIISAFQSIEWKAPRQFEAVDRLGVAPRSSPHKAGENLQLAALTNRLNELEAKSAAQNQAFSQLLLQLGDMIHRASSSLQSDIDSQASPPTEDQVPMAGWTIKELSDRLIANRIQDAIWSAKTAKQAKQTYSLFARYLSETHQLDRLSKLHQTHFAEFADLLRTLKPSYGKSSKDDLMPLNSLQGRTSNSAPYSTTLAVATRNRHLTFLGQLLQYAKSQGITPAGSITLATLRSRRTARARDQRRIPTTSEFAEFFRQPVFSGYASDKKTGSAGTAFYHRAEYFVPLLAYYTGGRREEICGLMVDDLATDMEGLLFLKIRPNALRTLKNVQSERSIALHYELKRLGFLEYVHALKSRGCPYLFPDLAASKASTPLGDTFYRRMRRASRLSEITLHQFRHGFGNALKQADVPAEIRSDLLGHRGHTETTERYSDAISIKKQLAYLSTLPVVTEHLKAKDIQLLPSVAVSYQEFI